MQNTKKYKKQQITKHVKHGVPLLYHPATLFQTHKGKEVGVYMHLISQFSTPTDLISIPELRYEIQSLTAAK